ncbi:hypothetical protein JCM8097_004705 [Rhodosporidiobolus ruineniae]
MSHSLTGPCLVCGDETTSRCQSCGKAGISLFFCSKEHQKLLWPVHKKVCGPGKANPFLWPDLAPDEVEDAKKHLNTDLAFGIPGFETFAATLRAMRIPESQHEDWIEALGEGRSANLTTFQKQQHLLTLRSAALERWRGPGIKWLDSLPVVLAYSANLACPTNIYPPHVPPYFSKLHHLVLAWAGLSYAVEKAKTAVEEDKLDRFIGGAKRRFIDFVDVDVRKTDPAAADFILNALDETTHKPWRAGNWRNSAVRRGSSV